MERADVQRMADSVLREYGVPMKVSAISAADGWVDDRVREPVSRDRPRSR